MNKNLILGVSYGLMFSLILTQPVFAADCYGSLTSDNPPTLGKFLPCFLEQTWGFMQKIFVAAAIILGMFLIYKTFTNRDNPKVLEELPSRWGYLILFALLAFGAGGTVLNFAFKLFGFGTLNSWIKPLTDLFANWDKLGQAF